MKIRVHADDCGVSRGVTDGILRCVDDGPVTGTSVVANGHDFERAITELRARPHVAVSVHLNLVEGPPLLPAPEVDLLVDESGLLRHDFFSLWRAHAFAGAATRARLESQVRAELRAQAVRVRDALGASRPLRLNTHQHLHHVPFAFRIAVDLAAELESAGLRLVREPSFLRVRAPRPGDLGGIARQTLLNALAARHRPVLASRGIACEDWFVGSLLSGRLTPAAVDACLRRIHAIAGERARDTTVEVVFHPGGAVAGEEKLWAHYPAIGRYYFEAGRRRESEHVRSRAMAECLARWSTVNPPAARPSGSTTAS